MNEMVKKNKPKLQLAKILKINRETKDTHTLTLQLSEPFEWALAQFIMVQAEIDGKSVRRAYTISSSPTRKNLEITVRQTDTPTMSKYLNEREVGDYLNIKGPYGRFIWKVGMSEKVVCIGAGSGITPTRAFLQFFIDKKLEIPIKVLYSCSYGDNVIFRNELNELIDQIPNASYSLSITRDKMELDNVRTGRIDEAFMRTELTDWKDAYYYLCGAPSFVNHMITHLENIGIPKNQIKKEKWG